MIKFNLIKDVEKNEDNGGYYIVEIIENDIKRNVMFGYDFGDSLGSVEIIDSDERLEDVFSEKVVDMCWNEELDWM